MGQERTLRAVVGWRVVVRVLEQVGQKRSIVLDLMVRRY